MAECCPISQRKTDAYLERIEAFLTAVMVAVFIVTCSFVAPLILAVDFVLKLSTENRYGIFRPVSKMCKAFFHLPKRAVDDGPKKFARLLGMIISFNLVVLYMLDLHESAVILSGVFILFALLEAFFDYCVGCKLYVLLPSMLKK